MRKSNNVIRNLLSIITIILIVILGNTQFNVSKASTDEGHEDNYSPTGDRTFVRLVHRDNNKVDVYLEMADSTIIEGTAEAKGASVASFQIGLDIYIDLEDEGSVINFEFDSALKENKNYELTQSRKDLIKEQNTEGEEIAIGEKLHIFYVGTKELNDARNTEGIKVGTISFDGINETETVTIIPNSEFTKLESIDYGSTEINIIENDALREILINKEDDNESGSGDNEGEGGGTTGEGNEGSDSTEGNEGESTEQNDSSEEKADSKKPNTGDIAIGTFVVLMIVSLLGIIMMTRKKKPSKHSK